MGVGRQGSTSSIRTILGEASLLTFLALGLPAAAVSGRFLVRGSLSETLG